MRAFLTRLKAKSSVCDLVVPCTQANCVEKVSYAEKIILHTLVRGLVDEQICEEVLAKSVEMNLDDTIKFVEAKETGHRSTN